MAAISSKIFEIFRNLKSDAIPQPPRPETEEVFRENENQETNDCNIDETNDDHEETEPQESKKNKKKKSHYNNFFKPKKGDSFSKKEDKDRKRSSNSNINVQATGNVINIVNSRDVHWGNEIVYYMGPTNIQQKQTKVDEEEVIEKSSVIMLVMEATIKPSHEYIDYISKNLGKNWHGVFLSLGYSKNRIETFEIDEAGKGISEVRYKILLDWVRNDDDGTLGKLTTQLWEEGERQLVKEVAIIYKKNKQLN
ncbi:unnamed protein product [Parnassius apollo]|uniref:(apollo) hypothetical protein n=1 Tax=Parnassius apollo TaxID=110799 RepID=A0A8S3WS65_PARAO|nr:unnamed protein product [Parnassius apollo]